MRRRSFVRTAVLSVGLTVAALVVAPQPAQAAIVCSFQRPLQNPTWFSVQCKRPGLNSDVYSAHIRCNGRHYHTGNYVTPVWGWGPWATVSCPAGQTWTSAWYETGD